MRIEKIVPQGSIANLVHKIREESQENIVSLEFTMKIEKEEIIVNRASTATIEKIQKGKIVLNTSMSMPIRATRKAMESKKTLLDQTALNADSPMSMDTILMVL
jgi:hypothetical protein